LHLTGTVAPSRVNVSELSVPDGPSSTSCGELGETADALIGDRDDRIALAYARRVPPDRRAPTRQPRDGGCLRSRTSLAMAAPDAPRVRS